MQQYAQQASASNQAKVASESGLATIQESPSQEAASELDLAITMLSAQIVELEKRAEKLLQPRAVPVVDCDKECDTGYPSSPITNTFRKFTMRVNGLTSQLADIISRLE